MLLHTQKKLDLITDVDMLLFLERGIRGGVSFCATRFAESQNSTTHTKPSGLAYVDANNLVI